MIEEEDPDEPNLYGLWQSHEFLPDKITIFRRPIERACTTPEEMADEIRVTVIHELAHHFGIEEDRIADLGWA